MRYGKICGFVNYKDKHFFVKNQTSRDWSAYTTVSQAYQFGIRQDLCQIRVESWVYNASQQWDPKNDVSHRTVVTYDKVNRIIYVFDPVRSNKVQKINHLKGGNFFLFNVFIYNFFIKKVYLKKKAT
jgi:hypothetical protein